MGGVTSMTLCGGGFGLIFVESLARSKMRSAETPSVVCFTYFLIRRENTLSRGETVCTRHPFLQEIRGSGIPIPLGPENARIHWKVPHACVRWFQSYLLGGTGVASEVWEMCREWSWRRGAQEQTSVLEVVWLETKTYVARTQKKGHR